MSQGKEHPPGRPSAGPTVGLSFREKLIGFHAPGLAPPDGSSPRDLFLAAEKAGRTAGRRLDATVKMTIIDLDRFLEEPACPALLDGTVRADGLTPPGGAPIASGRFNLYPDEAGNDAPRLHYVMPFIGADGEAYLVDGEADVESSGDGADPLATSTVYATIRQGTALDGSPVSAGLLRLNLLALLEELRTIAVFGTDSLARKNLLAMRFLKIFLGPLADSFLRGFSISG